MDYLIRFAHVHESFRKPELEALATLEDIKLEILDYQTESPFCLVRFHPTAKSNRPVADIARSFISRSILSRGIYEVWGQGPTYDLLHQDVHSRSKDEWNRYKYVTFRFSMDSFYGKRSSTEQREIISSFRYLEFEGKISMKNPEVEFAILEEWNETKELSHDMATLQTLEDNGNIAKRVPKRVFLGRYVGGTNRQLIEKHDLKKRPYISTTSMDAELALITATLALAAPGKIFLDPFVGTGGFMVAASELGAVTFGSDIDGRSYRGKGSGLENGVAANFAKYELSSMFGDCFTSDLTNTPLRNQGRFGKTSDRWLDGIISDPPYGVREGLKVLGTRQSKLRSTGIVNGTPLDGNVDDIADAAVPVRQPHHIGGVLAHTLPGYIAPKKPYSFLRMLDDILDFAARTLVNGGRLAFWMPNANEANLELPLPKHPLLELKHVCIQSFNKWSRRLLVFERIEERLVNGADSILAVNEMKKLDIGANADELNPFRRMYFEGFQPG